MDETMDKRLHKIINISKGHGIVPASVKFCSDGYTSAEVGSLSSEDLSEYTKLRKIVRNSKTFLVENDFDRQNWSTEVSSDVVHQVVQRSLQARFVPCDGLTILGIDKTTLADGMVDFVIAQRKKPGFVEKKFISRLHRALWDIDKHIPISVNYTNHGLLMFSPICVRVTTVNPSTSGLSSATAKLIL
ncbi:hypothetical protein BFW01_g10385 [Lasiodiplodia theobromae]|uniref:PD-(D/E)XK nuclease-like domain-containing protein n=1 Tax=Lasiodiplodia theobromae TaxID=45133 RepID=A0A8H7MA86_9PEZI|nr:hypothetical protein BFW01_g10385 [Lasiodiplodia theobromae]